ncbi:hybrid sensor histidine kinase/response regulator [Flammeovirgaceae bacterium SG7u.111]|nr:hybrid sensor histidine kinase/response regulator [Flammeovirgaceae bacterium SG7u.132]WPO33247.1 hybrid sensor histidine kinase/response regulator [Flammeovirgaceae bacterium SG7u.111]
MTYTILLADDEQASLMTNLTFLKELGENHSIIGAPDGEKALELVKLKKPDLVLSDWMMPKMTGMELLSALKSDPETKDIPVIMVTAMVTSKDLEKAFDEGATDYITKPVDKIELLARARAALQSYTYYKEMKRQKEELSVMNNQLTRAEKNLEELNNLKDVFFSVISNDLKQPLYSLTSFVDLLCKNINNFSKEEMRYVADNLKVSLYSVNTLLNSLKKWTELEKQQEAPVIVQENLYKITDESIEQVKHTFEQKVIRINNLIDPEQSIKTHKPTFQSIISILLESAAKFVVERGDFNITSKINTDFIEVDFEIPGFQVKDIHISNLFDLSYYMDNEIQFFEKGSGLGFVLSKMLLNRVGGKIDIDHKGGKPVLFKISLPHMY